MTSSTKIGLFEHLMGTYLLELTVVNNMIELIFNLLHSHCETYNSDHDPSIGGLFTNIALTYRS